MANFEDTLCRSAAKKLLASLQSLQSIHFRSTQLTDEQITALSKLNLSEQTTLVERAHYFMAVGLDPKALGRQLEELETLREEHELEDTYLLHGAPLALMRRLFGMHASEFSRRRNVLKLRGAGSGRPAQCDEQTEHRVWRLWQQFAERDERERFLAVTEQSDLDLHIIWSALRDHISR